MPDLAGFNPAEHVRVGWEGEEYRRFAARYDSPDGSLIVVSHETGPEIFFVVLGGAAAATTVIRGVYNLIEWVRAGRARGPARPEDVNAHPIRFLFIEDGTVRTRDVLPLDPPEGDAARRR